VILPDGDHVALHLTDCEMADPFRGVEQWHAGSRQTVMQFEYSDLIDEPIAPPAIEGRRYVLWAFASAAHSEVPREAPWTAHPQGLLLVRGRGDREFVFWGGKSYLVSALRDAIQRGDRVPLDEIADPVRRCAGSDAARRPRRREGVHPGAPRQRSRLRGPGKVRRARTEGRTGSPHVRTAGERGPASRPLVRQRRSSPRPRQG